MDISTNIGGQSSAGGAVASVNGKTGDVVLGKGDLGITNDFTTIEKNKLSGISSFRKMFGLLIPQFKTIGKFDYLGAALPANQLALHSSGTGLVSSTAGTFSDGYLKLSSEVTGYQANRLDWLLSWNTSEAGASISVGLGDAANGYLITITNTGGNVVVTWPSGATVSAALTGIVNLSLSITTGNTWITCSVSVIGVVALALVSTNPYNVPVFEYVKLSKPNLAHVYFKNNSTACRIVGFMHNSKSYDGDPTGQLLTQSVVVNSSWLVDEDENMIIIPPRVNQLTPVRFAFFAHGRTQNFKSSLDVSGSVGDSGRQAMYLIDAGYMYGSVSGGIASSDIDGFGSIRWLEKVKALIDTAQENIKNIYGVFMIGWSMGGLACANFIRLYPDLVKAISLSCPVLDAQETGIVTTLGVPMFAAYAPFYICIKDAVTTDPRTDDGTNWAKISDPGLDPGWGIKLLTATRTTAATTNGDAITLATNIRMVPGDTIYFKFSRVSAKIVQMVDNNTTFIKVDRNITVVSGEPVSIMPIGRDLSNLGTGYEWRDRLTQEITVGTPYNKGKIVRRTSANPLNDMIPFNPTNFPDMYAELGIPIEITVGGDGTATGNDGILNNNQMFTFAAKVNALKPGLVNIISRIGNHVSPNTVNSAGTVPFFNSIV